MRTTAGRRFPDTPSVRDRVTGQEAPPYPLRTVGGLQYFFPLEYRSGRGNIYFESAPWGLTAISQFAFWRQRVRPVGEFLGQISVDLDDWHAFATPDGEQTISAKHGNTAWNSSAQEIGRNSWEQIKSGLMKDYAAGVDAPRYLHIDRHIVFNETKVRNSVGSMVLRISQPGALVGALTAFANFEMRVGPQAQGPAAPPAAPATESKRGGLRLLAPTLAEETNSNCEHVFATPLNDTELPVSPKAHGTRFVVAFRIESASPFYVIVDGKGEPFSSDRPSTTL